MKNLAIDATLVVSAIALAFFVVAGYATQARCAYCPDLPCYGTCATPGCVCVTQPGKTSGKCYGVNYSTKFKQLGWLVGD